MQKLKYIFIAFFIFSLTATAQTTTPYDFLKLSVNPKAAVIGGGFVANNDDPNVIFHNPAGIGSLEGKPASFSFFNHLEGIKFLSAAYSHNFSEIGRFALGLQYISYGEFTKADDYGNVLGTFNAGDFAFTIGYSNILDENFFYGINLKYIYSSIDGISSSAIAGDVGLQYVIPDNLIVIGLSAQNIGKQISKYFDTDEDLPLEVKLGFSKKLKHVPLKFYLSLNGLNDEDDRFKKFSIGGEIKLSKVIHVRMGYDNDKRKDWKLGNSAAGLAGFSIGFGLKIKKYFVDYGFSSMGEIGAWHRFSVSTTF